MPSWPSNLTASWLISLSEKSLLSRVNLSSLELADFPFVWRKVLRAVGRKRSHALAAPAGP